MRSIYVIGSLRNPEIGAFGKVLRELGYDAFTDWWSVGPHADDSWRDHEKLKGHDQVQALLSWSSRNIFMFDKYHLDRCEMAVLVLPAGKSGCIELGYTIGRGKPAFVVLDGDPDRYDVMLSFATQVFRDAEEFFAYMRENT